MTTADPNARDTWPQRRNALRFEAGAKWAMQLAVLSALGALGAWCLALALGELKFSRTFWLLVVLIGIWATPVQAYVRWTMLSLWAFLLLWPALAGAALLYDVALPAGGAAATPASPGLLATCLAFSVLMSGAGFAALRRSSLPGGRATPTFMRAGARPAGATPDVDPALIRIQLWLLLPLIFSILCLCALFAVFPVSPDPARIVIGLAPLLAVAVTEPVLLAWGQYQARRQPGRRPAALLGLAALQAGLVVGITLLVLGVGLAQGRDGLVGAGVAMALLGTAAVACDVVAAHRILARVRAHGGT